MDVQAYLHIYLLCILMYICVYAFTRFLSLHPLGPSARLSLCVCACVYASLSLFLSLPRAHCLSLALPAKAPFTSNQLRPTIYHKMPHILSDEPFFLLNERQYEFKKPHVLSEELNTLSKQPYIH